MINPMDALTVVRNPNIPDFGPGDTVKVGVKVVEGGRERLQNFEGVVIRKNKPHQPDGTFTVRRVSHGVGVERTFAYASPRVDKVDVMRRGKVRRARLYYLRGLSGKAARIKERRLPAQSQRASAAAGAKQAAAPDGAKQA